MQLKIIIVVFDYSNNILLGGEKYVFMFSFSPCSQTIFNEKSEVPLIYFSCLRYFGHFLTIKISYIMLCVVYFDHLFPKKCDTVIASDKEKKCIVIILFDK